MTPAERSRLISARDALQLVLAEGVPAQRGGAAMSDAKRMLHCRESGPEDDGCPTTCMLPDGHSGPHQWTLDDNVLIDFASTPEPTP